MTEPDPVDLGSGTERLLEEMQATRLAIETPERVRIVYDLAGIGSRFAAGSVDMTILLCLNAGVAVVISLLGNQWVLEMSQNPGAFFMAAMGIFYLILWGYFLGFETFWSGQTPGKWVMRIRVVSEEGGPASVSAIFVRNLLRVVDALPILVAHGGGGIVMIMHARHKRVGDLAAGTIVVRERPTDLGIGRLEEVARAPRDVRPDELNREELELAQRFAARMEELTVASRKQLAERIVARIEERIELPGLDAGKLLILLAQGRQPSELRDVAGPDLELPEEPRP